MIRNRQNAFAFGAMLTALALAGCGNKNTPAPVGGGPTAPAGGGASQIPTDVTGAALGTRLKAEAFRVDMRVNGALKKGENQFMVTVTKDGQPVTDANVRVLLTMPGMKMFGSEIIMSHAEGGRYEGIGNLTMAGDWQANLTVTSGPITGDAVYDFHLEAP